VPPARLTVALPCYNEEQALPGLLTAIATTAAGDLAHWDVQVLVVDDGSSDGTAAIARNWKGGVPVHLVQHAVNRGLGGALDTAVRTFAAEAGKDDLLAVMDADGTHPPSLLPGMLRLLIDANLDVVIASRYAPGGAEHGLSPLRLAYSRLASLAMRMFAPVRGARDYSCGYRVYRAPALQRALERFGDHLITERSFVCMAELLVKLGRSGARVGEVGLDLHYELKQGASKMNVPATIRRYVVFAWRALFDPRFR
jgi:dolichol-phosphate mannosyltransferase